MPPWPCKFWRGGTQRGEMQRARRLNARCVCPQRFASGFLYSHFPCALRVLKPQDRTPKKKHDRTAQHSTAQITPKHGEMRV